MTQISYIFKIWGSIVNINIWIFAVIVIVCGILSWFRKLYQLRILRFGLVLLIFTIWVLYGCSIKGLYYDSSVN